MRTVHVETVLPVSADRVWTAMLSPRTEPLWRGERGTGWLIAFHLIPAYRHTIEVVEVDQATGTIRNPASKAESSRRGITPCMSKRCSQIHAATAIRSTSTRGFSPVSSWR